MSSCAHRPCRVCYNHNVDALLEIEDLHVGFRTGDGLVRAVDGVSLRVGRGETLCIVGESGCGKSALAMSIPKLLPHPAATFSVRRMTLDGMDISALQGRALREIRGKRIGVIFQEPMTSLSPLHRIGDQIAEAIRLHSDATGVQAREMALEWLGKVGMADPARVLDAWPHELSGGMQQRVMVAMALVHDPDLVIADEPTTALDVATQAQILNLLRRLVRRDSGLLLITHDMGVVREMATHVAVMYAGQIVETAPANLFFKEQRHPYSRALLASLPSSATHGKRLPVIPGSVPSPLDWPTGCRFRNRCSLATPQCATPPPVHTDPDGRTWQCLI